MLNTIFIPGYGNSTEGHWQELWHKATKNSYWVEQKDWENPNCEEWVESLNKLIQSLEEPIFLIAHSLGTNTVVEWSNKYKENILGAMFVAIPDVDDKNIPDSISGYKPSSLEKLPFPSLALASTNDPYSTLDRTKYFVKKWGCELITIGDKGHVNNDSGVGEWPEGRKLLNNFLNSLGVRL